MYKVRADTLEEYFAADPARRGDLEALDALIRENAPGLRRWFYAGAADGKPGMRMGLIGYGAFQYEMNSGARVEWPIIGMALQKNYLSLYTSVYAGDAPIVDRYAGTLGELRAGANNFSFVTADQLDRAVVAALIRDIEDAVRRDPIGSLRYGRYRVVSAAAEPGFAGFPGA
jgi:hypothetical protein